MLAATKLAISLFPWVCAMISWLLQLSYKKILIERQDMAEFGLSEAQEMFRAHVRNFTRRELMPTAKKRVRLNRVPAEVIKKLAVMLCSPLAMWGIAQSILSSKG